MDLTEDVKPPESPEDLERLLRDLGEVEGELQKGAASFDAAVRRVTESHTEKAKPLHARRNELIEAIASYATEHRSELVKPGTKMIELSSGVIKWIKGKPKVSFSKTDEPGILDFLRWKGRLRKFTNPQPPKIDKRKLLADRDFAVEIPGVRVTEGEVLIITPESSQLETIKQGNPYHIPPKED